MKNYFNFSLTGAKFLPIWILFLVLFMAPYSFIIYQSSNLQPGDQPPLYFFPLLLIVLLIALILSYYITRISIENIQYNGKNLEFKGTFGVYIGKVLLGLLLSIITLGIYTAWFMRDITRFFVDNTLLNSQPFAFKGRGGSLFIILLLTLIVPILILSFIMVKALSASAMSQPGASMIIIEFIMLLVLIPYIYFVYKWMVNVDYKTFNISWDTDFLDACGKILLEFVLIVITLGIYTPLAVVRLYKYFTSKTLANSDSEKLRFDYEIDGLNDFLFIWGQTLLTIITLGIYYPWAYSKIGNRILRKTFSEKLS